jgi:hypothetical protein
MIIAVVSYCKLIYRSALQSAALHSSSGDRQPATYPEHISSSVPLFPLALGINSDRGGKNMTNNNLSSSHFLHRHAANRSKEIQRVMRVHRDPFEPVMCVLEADSPSGGVSQDHGR